MSRWGIRKARGGICAPGGVKAAAGSAGVKTGTPTRLDVALVAFEPGSVGAAVFTTNRVKAAPVLVSQRHVRSRELRGVVMNSGNANACVGPEGVRDAERMCEQAARVIGCDPRDVLVCSTGRIGRRLPIERMLPVIGGLTPRRGGGQSEAAARAIMTSDTVPKEAAVRVEAGGRRFHLGGLAKGAGMIDPNMATMLAVVATDLGIPRRLLRSTLRAAVDRTFNRITVDGDMSTNDTVILVATGTEGGEGLEAGSDLHRAFAEALERVCLDLALQIVRDGESVTRFVEVRVRGARSDRDARKAAEAVANSTLTKCAWAGGDPNWGRILDALGYSGARFDPGCTKLYYDDLLIACDGAGVDPALPAARRIAAKKAFRVTADLGAGEGEWIVYTTDLTEGYVAYNLSE